MIRGAAQARSICLRCQLRLLDRTGAPRSLNRPSPFGPSRRFYSSETVWEALEQQARPIDKSQGKNFRNSSAWEALENSAAKKNAKPRGSARAVSNKDEFFLPKSLLSWDDPLKSKYDGDFFENSAAIEESVLEADPLEPVYEETAPEAVPQLQGHDAGREAHPNRQSRYVGGRQVVLESEQLGMNSLGKKTHTIIIREQLRGARLRKLALKELGVSYQGGIRVDNGIPVEDESVDIGMKLEELSKIRKDDAIRNIDELRPSNTTIITNKQFRALQKVLVEGFTVPQLQSYINKNKDNTPKRDGPKYPWIVEQGRWLPLKRLSAENLSPKEKTVLKVMRGCWKLEIREYLDGIGRLEIKVGVRVLNLLFSEENKLLNDIKRSYLDQGEKIEVVRSDHRVHIFARKAKAETVLEKFNDIAESIKSQTIPVGWISKKPLDDAMLEELGRITSTYVQKASHKGQAGILVAWIQDGEAPAHLESRHDLVIRMLYAAMVPEAGQNIIPALAEGSAGILVPAVRGQETWSWKDRLTKWARLVVPTGTDPKIAGTEAVTSDTLRQSLPSSLSLQSISAPTPTANEGWGMPYTVTAATFGHALHSVKTNKVQKSPIIVPNETRIFSPIAPPPSSFIQLDSIILDAPETHMIFRFRQHPVQGENAQGTAPSFELHVTIPEDLPGGIMTWENCQKRLFAVQNHQNADTLLPAESVDVRIAQSQVSELASGELQQLDGLRNFINTSQLYISAGKLLTPSRLSARLPASLITHQKQADGASLTNEAVAVEYLFTGLEMRRTIEAEHQGHRLRYSTIVTGIHGGRRAELTLEAVQPDTSSSQDVREAYAQSYFALVHDIALGKLVSWVGEKKSHMVKDVQESVEESATTKETPTDHDAETSTHSSVA